MKIVLMHYHLQPGGVSTVIRQQIEALKENADILVIAGRLPTEALPVGAVEIPALYYTEKHPSQPSPEVTARNILHAISARWSKGCDLIHVHNPLLAKNSELLDILLSLQKYGQRLLLQIHDFAEDGRPAAYYGRDYPVDCHYGVINRRDYRMRQVIRRVIDNPNAAQRLKAMNNWLKGAGRLDGMQPTIDRNRRTVRQIYSLDAYCKALMAAYKRVIAHTVRHHIDRRRLLGHFLRPERFSLLKWERYGG